MIDYTPPTNELRFLLSDVLHVEDTLTYPYFDECDAETFFSIIDAIGDFAKETLLPLNEIGDRAGPRLIDGLVKSAPGFPEAYKVFSNHGWNALPLEKEHGGQGLPFMLHAVLRESMASTNLAFALVHELNFGVYEAILACGNQSLKDQYLEKLCSGEWAGTMCLTEPHCGTDLGLIRSKATPRPDDTYTLDGQKIFITWGDHDMSENIVHLVLARVKGAQEGVRGLSLFLVPKFRLKDGAPNYVTVSALEDKMGLHGSPTCALSFDGSQGWLVGKEGSGLNAMFIMMNAARLSVGLQGVGVAETAYQAALNYAKDRRQGRAISERLDPNEKADPITVHPDVQRRLLLMRAEVDTGRALAFWGAQILDCAHRHPDLDVRAYADQRISLLTPVIKSYLSEMASRVANQALQMHGGHGYVKDYGVEQLVRDVRITEIYEGTNAIQGIDLVIRKVRADGGAVMRTILKDVKQEVSDSLQENELKNCVNMLKVELDQFEEVTQFILNGQDHQALTSASDYLDAFAIILCAMLALKSARVAICGDSDAAQYFRAQKVNLANIYLKSFMPKLRALCEIVSKTPESYTAEFELIS